VDQLPYATRFIIQSLEPGAKSWMGEFQLPSAKTHTMLLPAGIGHTQSGKKVEALWCKKFRHSNAPLI
jgi:hypothetical protein